MIVLSSLSPCLYIDQTCLSTSVHAIMVISFTRKEKYTMRAQSSVPFPSPHRRPLVASIIIVLVASPWNFSLFTCASWWRWWWCGKSLGRGTCECLQQSIGDHLAVVVVVHQHLVTFRGLGIVVVVVVGHGRRRVHCDHTSTPTTLHTVSGQVCCCCW